MIHFENFSSPDLDLIWAEARQLSIRFRHGFIDSNHLYVSLFSTDCEARRMIPQFDTGRWMNWLEKYYEAGAPENKERNMPLTVFAEHVVEYTQDICKAYGDYKFSSVHLLLALLCVDCEITTYINTLGILYKDLTGQHYGRPMPKVKPVVLVTRDKPYSKIQLSFMTAVSREKKIDVIYADAVYLYVFKLYDECLKVCEAGLSLDPAHLELRFLQLDCYKRQLAVEPALQLVAALQQEAGLSVDKQISLSNFYDMAGQYEQAGALIDAVLAVDPENNLALHAKGFNLSQQKKYIEALPYLEKMVEKDPEYAYGWDNLGFVLHKLGKAEEGLAMIERSLKLDRGNSYAYKNKGIIFMDLGKREDALREFQLALRYGYTQQYGYEVLDLMKQLG